ncbi:MAG: hypothetical protein ABSG01_15475 [Anaerolineales bacterium]
MNIRTHPGGTRLVTVRSISYCKYHLRKKERFVQLNFWRVV